METATWDDALHPREDDTGRFEDKSQSVPEISLVEDGEPADREPYKPRYHVLRHLEPLAIKKLDQANARLAKLGIEERFEYTIERTTDVRDGIRQEYSVFELERPSIGFGGWSFTGAHDFTPAGKVLHFHATTDAPAVKDNHCDHCGHNRARGRVYTVFHPEKGRMQVGSNCLEAFLGVKPSGLWALESEIDLDKFEEYSNDRNDIRSRVYDPEDLIVAALAASDDGRSYISASKGSYTDQPTASAVSQKWDELLAHGDNDERRKLARKVQRWARALDAAPGTYQENLKSVFAGKKDEVYVSRKHIGLAVSVVSAYRRAEEQAAEAAADVKQKVEDKREYLAAPGEKVEDITATVRLLSYGSASYYGNVQHSTFIVMRSDDGHILTWNASGTKDLEVGQKVRITKATVKGNEMYRDTFQTQITRAKLEPVDADALPHTYEA